MTILPGQPKASHIECHPNVQQALRLRILKLFPEFKSLASEAVNQLEHAHTTSVDANEKSNERAHSAYEDVRRILEGELKNEDLSEEQRTEIYGLLMETADKQDKKDSENKKVLGDWLKLVGVGAALSLAAAVVFVGGRFLIEGNEDEDSSN